MTTIVTIECAHNTPEFRHYVSRVLTGSYPLHAGYGENAFEELEPTVTLDGIGRAIIAIETQFCDKVLERLILADVSCGMKDSFIDITPSPELRASLDNQSRAGAQPRPSVRARPAYRL